MTVVAVLAASVAGACSWVLPFPEIDERAATGAAAPGGSHQGGAGGVGGVGGDGASAGSGGASCAAPCEGGACDTPLDVVFLRTSTPTNMGSPSSPPDGVLPVGLAAAGDRVVASMRFQPFISDGPDLPVLVSGTAIYELAPQAPSFLVKTYECHQPNGTVFSGGLALTADHIFNLLTSPAQQNNGEAELASSTAAIGSGCGASANTAIAQNNVNGSLVPFIFRFGTSDPLGTFDFVTNENPGSSVVLDVGASPDGGTVAVVGVTPFAVFGSGPPVQNLNYFTLRLDVSTGAMTTAWLHFTQNPPAEVGGTFPTISVGAAIAVDESGGTWTTGTIDASGSNRMFVEHRLADGSQGELWVAQQESFGKSIAVAGDHVVVGGNFEGAFDVPGGTLDATGRDFVVLHFDATSFPLGNPMPTWSYPAFGAVPAHETDRDDALSKLAIGAVAGCDHALFALSCNGDDCAVNDGLQGVLQRLDIATGEVLSTRSVVPGRGSIAVSQLVIQPDGAWFGGELKGELYGQISPVFVSTQIASGAALFAKLPL